MRLFEILDKSAEYNRITDAIRQKMSPIGVSCANTAQKAHFISSVLKKSGKRAIIICPTDMESGRMCDDLRFFMGSEAVSFPSKDYMYYNADSASKQSMFDRTAVLEKIRSGAASAVTVGISSLLQFTLPRDIFEKNRIEFSLGKIFDLEMLSKQLVLMGYKRVDTVEGTGQFSLRGGIIDIFSPNYEEPVRVEFFDDETDSVRFFDVYTQTTVEKVTEAVIIPCRELIYEDDVKEKIIKTLISASDKAEKSGNEERAAKYRDDAEKFENEGYFVSDDRFASFVYDSIPTLYDYFDDDDLIFFSEPRDISESAESFTSENAEILTELDEKNLLLPKSGKLWADYKKLISRFKKGSIVSLSEIGASAPDFRVTENFNLMSRPVSGFHGKTEFLCDDISDYKQRGFGVLVLCGSESRGKNFTSDLNTRGFECVYKENKDNLTPGTVMACSGSLSGGFEYSDAAFVIISDKEAFKDKREAKRKAPEDSAGKLRSFTDISPGDYVVHQAHGIGRYEGIKKLNVGGVTKDYLKIAYHGTDVLYVSVEQLDNLYKYIGAEGKSVKVNKLGGTEWTKTKMRVKESAKALAEKLIKLYGERMNSKGFAFSEDSVWQRQFEDGCGFEETPDQLRSIEEVKKDMETPRPMDRLLCGDVGYGKTEVALRASFKAVMDSKQVAYLCPTTLLAMQHFHTYSQRMKDFPVKVEMLSRFKTAAEQKKVIEKLRTGEVDIVIGTHRMLSKDITFKNLGLLVVDEEQRFGVGHKEKLKELKKDVDVLTLSATPIPRTLHMAMVNIRDMSVITQPPKNRYPVTTFVMQHDLQTVSDAMKREIARGGQVYYLFNNVSSINKKAAEIQSLIPDARIAVGHGKMSEEALERIMMRFLNREIDVLVCTTIIETGLDISNVNTIIIENSDRMGLAQLYQLRGRVGRSNRNAYAYLTYHPDKALSDVARKRLSAIREFTEFGSGFKIALRDLEIRGAGNILGPEQHGHMDAVGYDMYCKLLKESVSELSGEKSEQDRECSIDISVSAFIPDSYIRSQSVRIDIYKRISSIRDISDSYDIEEELVDRFGDIPKPVNNIIDIALIKAYAISLGICDISEKDKSVVMKFEADSMDMKVLSKVISEGKGQILFSAGVNPYITVRGASEETDGEKISNIKFLLQRMKELKFEE